MAAYYLDDWKKRQEDMCDFIRNHGSPADFDDFEDMVGRLERVMTDEVSEIFVSKDSFLWFGLFARFRKLGLEDQRFMEFMTEFIWQSEFLTLLFDVVFFSFCIWFLFWVSAMVMKLIAKADGKDGTDRKGEE